MNFGGLHFLSEDEKGRAALRVAQSSLGNIEISAILTQLKPL